MAADHVHADDASLRRRIAPMVPKTSPGNTPPTETLGMRPASVTGEGCWAADTERIVADLRAGLDALLTKKVLRDAATAAATGEDVNQFCVA